MSFNPMNKLERDSLVKGIISVITNSYSEYEKILVLCWIYEIVLSYTAELIKLNTASYDLVRKHFGSEKLFMQIVKVCRDDFIHRGMLPSENHISAIKNEASKIVLVLAGICDLNDSYKVNLLSGFINCL